MRYTVCPPGPEPVRYTASCPEMVRRLDRSLGGDLTLDPRAMGLWQVWDVTGNPMGVPVEDLLKQMSERRKV